MYPPLLNIGVADLLESDPRPTFVVALPSSSSPATPAELVYSNPALTRASGLLDKLLSSSELEEEDFWKWISTIDGSVPHSCSHHSAYWTKNVLHSTWVVVSCNLASPPMDISRLCLDSPRDYLGMLQNHSSAPPTPAAEVGLDYEKPKPTRVASEPEFKLPDLSSEQNTFLDVVENVDWSATSLGPMDNWPPYIQQTYSQILCNSQPSAIYWGEDLETIYNEAFSELLGPRHPSVLGKPMAKVFPDMADQIRKLMDVAVTKQRASNEDETRFFVETNNGRLLETYLKWSIVPLIQNHRCYGFVHSIADSTMYHLFRRRLKMLVNMGDQLIAVKDVKSYWTKLIEELSIAKPSYDIPLAILYSIEKEEKLDKESTKHGFIKICHLEGALGVSGGHPITPRRLHLGYAEDGLATQFRKALRTRRPLLISTEDGTLPKDLLEGISWRGFGDPCTGAIVIPIRPTKDEEAMGLLVIGLNPRRPYDDSYKLYIRLLNQKLTTSLACTVLIEEERRRGRNAAEQARYDQAILKEKLAHQTQEAIEYTRLFQTVSEFIPNGFSIGDHQGNITFANDLWYRITGYPERPASSAGFLAYVVEEDREKIRSAYIRLKKTDQVNFEFREQHSPNPNPASPFRSPGIERSGFLVESVRHVMAQAKAERARDGTIIRTFTCLTDVTAHRRTADEAVRRAQEAVNLKRMAELATVGMFDMDMTGRLLGANNVFYELCGIDKVNPLKVEVRPWATSVVEEDLPHLTESISKLSREAKPQVAEVRLKTTWIAQDKAGNNITAPRWVNATFMPVQDSDGVVQSVTGCLSDVSLPKWQLELETERKEEAIESKRQQDNFIDMTSHEMRNPLSAIVHCSDAIIASLSKSQEMVDQARERAIGEEPGGSGLDTGAILELLADSIDNAETIVACAQHQKRIVDDILTMSKLDSKLLAVTPCTVNPIQIGQEALRMFDVEARRVDIDLSMTIDGSYTDMGYEYLDLDPSRVKQVLINLLTNALKFTKSGSTRNVSVSMKASLERPSDETSAVTFIPRSCDESAEYEQPALEGRKDPVYLMFEVKDTGQGLTEEEKSNLFNRFVQASSRTHVKYGGSGLGLFISRRLIELQKGAIGVSSLPGVGSTFAFFIEAYVPSEANRQEAELAAAEAKASAQGANTPPKRVVEREVPSGDRHDPRIDGVLIVEDNLINQQITRRGLQDRGFKVDVANHGVEALEKLNKSIALRNGTCADGRYGGAAGSPLAGINMILMDIEMPVQDGLTCTQKIRELESQGKEFCASGGRIPIIAVSANARTEQIRQAKMAGCDDVLVKPYRMPELIEKMQTVARRVAGQSKPGGVPKV
ncbi:virulence sensor protein bvgS [Sodiomyces alkalinus F11]|uniref:Virulence sensor protein bvgS n=1 Tax=Sodiomyces alkalinus (strain CBS 110278 / VKM F-3762 / F11) TaxID=1314773 RepID=A0A3N2PSX1_SODAK|nr:virulence sensor protein bvgS [Sodiomyces alkalinus F11]ROT37611.1 virulence sensor protein bvgS [Sodiomyces alkalinus F11]